MHALIYKTIYIKKSKKGIINDDLYGNCIGFNLRMLGSCDLCIHTLLMIYTGTASCCHLHGRNVVLLNRVDTSSSLGMKEQPFHAGSTSIP